MRNKAEQPSQPPQETGETSASLLTRIREQLYTNPAITVTSDKVVPPSIFNPGYLPPYKPVEYCLITVGSKTPIYEVGSLNKLIESLLDTKSDEPESIHEGTFWGGIDLRIPQLRFSEVVGILRRKIIESVDIIDDTAFLNSNISTEDSEEVTEQALRRAIYIFVYPDVKLAELREAYLNESRPSMEEIIKEGGNWIDRRDELINLVRGNIRYNLAQNWKSGANLLSTCLPSVFKTSSDPNYRSGLGRRVGRR